MKSIILLLHISLFISFSATAQKISADQVPVSVLNAFKNKFANATNLKWEKENTSDYEVNFKLDKEEISARFDSNGKWIETETEIEKTQLPQAIQVIIINQFAGWKIIEATLVDDVKHGKCYEVEIKKEKEKFDVLLTPDGQLISKTKVTD